MIRLIGAFILPFIYFKHGVNYASIYIIILFLSDAIDGFLARLLNASTFFGSSLDALSDKLLNAVSFIILGIEYNILLAPLAIEVAIMYTSYSTYRYGGNVKSSVTGKIKTIVLDIAVIFIFLLLSLTNFNITYSFLLKIMDYTNIIIYVLSFIIIMAGLIALVNYIGINKEARLNPNCMNIKYKNKKRKIFKQIIKEFFDIDYYKKYKNESIMKQLYIN